MGNNKSLFIFVVEIELCDVDDYNIETYSGYFEEEKFGNYCPLLLRQR